MDLSQFRADVRPSTAATVSGREAVCERHWRELLAQVADEVVAPLSAALERMATAVSAGRLDRVGLEALRVDLDQARRVGLAARQISRFGSGRVRHHPRRCQLAQAMREALAQRSRDVARFGIELHQDPTPAEVMIDATMLPTLLHALIDWCLEHTCSRLELAIDVNPWPAHARLHCRFTQRPAVEAAAGAIPGLPAGSSTLDSTVWRLIERLAQAQGLLLQRAVRDGKVQLTLEFPRTVDEALPRPPAPGAGPVPQAWANPRPMVGRHVLVVAARRETRTGVRGALRTMGLMLDFVASVEEAREFCEQGLPHAIVYEAALAGDRFRGLRAGWSAAEPQLAFIEITEHGQARLVSEPGQDRATGDPVSDGLGPALVAELVAAV